MMMMTMMMVIAKEGEGSHPPSSSSIVFLLHSLIHPEKLWALHDLLHGLVIHIATAFTLRGDLLQDLRADVEHSRR